MDNVQISVKDFLSPFSCNEFVFWLKGTTLILDKFYEWNRPSKRHKMKATNSYIRLNRNSTMRESDVPLSDEIAEQAIKDLIKKINVQTWSTYNK